MAKQIFTLIFVLFSFAAIAHQPDISTMVLAEQEDGSWILQVSAALTAYEYEINTAYGKDAFKTPDEFKKLVLRHLTEHISFRFGKQTKVVLSKGVVKLGHETNVIFQVSGVPKNMKNCTVKNTCFKNIYDNKCALIILKKGYPKKQFILNNKNAHTIYFKNME
jgi:hypothetical protein